jgi:uncharacterized protein (DUF1778 family)
MELVTSSRPELDRLAALHYRRAALSMRMCIYSSYVASICTIWYATLIVHMARISMVVPDEDLALIDAAASSNRTAFMLSAAREAARRVLREREDAELARILEESAEEDRVLLGEFSGTLADGL